MLLLPPTMRFRRSGTFDSLLLTGGAFGLVALFQDGLQQALRIPASSLSLIPALLVLSMALVIRWRASCVIESRDRAEAERVTAAERQRNEELERLLLFGQSLAGSLSLDELRKATARHLPSVVSHADVWAVVKSGSDWDRLMDVGRTRWRAGEIERIADLVATLPQVGRTCPDGFLSEGHVCFAMLAGSRSIGVIGMPVAVASPEMRRNLGAAAALLMVAAHNSQLFTEVRDNGVKDGLTGCYNRTHALQMLDNELARSKRTRSPLSLVLFDVDHFKQINDRCGHLAGDAVLDAIGDHLRRLLRRSDIRCRYGGDEFMLVLPETPATGAARVVESLRAEIERNSGRVTADGEQIPVTISVGVTSTIGGEAPAAELIERADRALYHAKAAGRNCVRIQSSTEGTVTAPPMTLRPMAPLDDETPGASAPPIEVVQ